MTLIRWRPPNDWDPFNQLSRLQDELNRLFGSAFTQSGEFAKEGWAPPVDICEEGDEYVVTVDLPGVRKDDIQLSASANSLILEGERKKEEIEEQESYLRTERVHGQFQRVIELPIHIDPEKINARYKDGVLVIRVTKAKEATPRQIPVKGE